MEEPRRPAGAQPGRRLRARHGAACHPRRPRRGAGGRRGGLQGLARTSPAKRAEIILKAAQLMRERIEEIGGRDDPRTGQADRPGAARNPARLRDHRMGRPARAAASTAASSPASRACAIPCCASRSASSPPSRRGISRCSSPARKVGGALSAGCSIILKASEETPGRRRTAGARLRRCRPAAGRAQPGVRQAVGDLGLPDPAAGGAAGDLHRLDSGRQASDGDGRRAHEAGDHGTGRPRAGHRLRRRRSRRQRRRPRPWPSRATPARSASRRRASSSQEAIYDRFTEAFDREGRARSRSATGSIPPTRWARSPTTGGSRRWKRWSPTPGARARGS